MQIPAADSALVLESPMKEDPEDPSNDEFTKDKTESAAEDDAPIVRQKSKQSAEIGENADNDDEFPEIAAFSWSLRPHVEC